MFTGKHLCCSLFLIKLHEVFINTYFEEHLQITTSVQFENENIFKMKVSAQENKATDVHSD